MRIVVNILLVIIIGGLVYLLISSIREPITFANEKKKREGAVIEKLKEIRTVQQFHKDIHGIYSNNFDSLEHAMRTDSFIQVRVSGDPDEVGGDFELDTFYKPAYDTIQKLNINLDSMRYVPFTEGETFDIKADTIQYQKTKSAVVQVGVQRKKFMGPFADPAYAKYDKRYDPDTYLKFGDMNKPSVSGNWE